MSTLSPREDCSGLSHVNFGVPDVKVAFEHTKRIGARFAEEGLEVLIRGEDSPPDVMVRRPYCVFYWLPPGATNGR